MPSSRLRPSPATLIALLALFVALGGPAEAQKRVKGLINGKQIRKETITSRQVKDGSLSRTQLSAKAVKQLKRTPLRSVGRDQLRSDAVTGDKIADGSIGSTAVADKTLTAADIADGSLSSGVFAGDAIGNAELADNAVGKVNMRAGSVGKSEIGDEAVGTEELINGVAVTSDIGAFTGTLFPTFPAIPPTRCVVANDQPVQPVKAPTAERPATDLTRTIVLAGKPAGWPDGVTLSAKPLNATTLRFEACNFGTAAVTPNTAQGSAGVSFVALAVG